MDTDERLVRAWAACDAALAYDAAIQRRADAGKAWVEGDDLDALYGDWITKAESALEDRGELLDGRISWAGPETGQCN